ncbi:MAG: type IV pilus modification PilV family protein [Minisyncoccia bacterium]
MSLIEIVVSIGILAAMLAVFGTLVRLGALGSDTGQESIARTVADSELENLRAAGYAALPASGSFSATGLSALPSGTGSVTVSSFNTETKEVDVAVSWVGTSGANSLTLSTLITQSGGLP